MGLLPALLAFLCAGALTLLGFVWAFQAHGIYRFAPSDETLDAYDLPGTREVWIRSEDGTELRVWVRLPEGDGAVILSFYGNPGLIGPSMERFAPLIEKGYGVVIAEYRGSGKTGGKPSERNFARDARAVYDQLDFVIGREVPVERRVLHGFSLGVGVGSRLAAERDFAAIVLEASFPRACRIYEKRFRGFPLCRLMWRERYDVADHVARISVPKLFVHGALDKAVPVAWGRELYEGASGVKRFMVLPEGGHSGLGQHGLMEVIDEFLAEHVAPRGGDGGKP